MKGVTPSKVLSWKFHPLAWSLRWTKWWLYLKIVSTTDLQMFYQSPFNIQALAIQITVSRVFFWNPRPNRWWQPQKNPGHFGYLASSCQHFRSKAEWVERKCWRDSLSSFFGKVVWHLGLFGWGLFYGFYHSKAPLNQPPFGIICFACCKSPKKQI